MTLVGGYTAGAALDAPVTVVRYSSGAKSLLHVANKEEALRHFKLKNGDVVVVAHILTKDLNFDYNFSSLPGDSLFYPSYVDNVFVIGAVSQPGAYPFSPNYTVRDYALMAGPVKFAQMGRIRVITGVDKRLVKVVKQGFHLSPGDSIIVPERAWTSDNVIKWYNTIANSIITGFTVRELIRR